ncbi:hypothetical protein M0804_010590 [Polistes exclamans]|nr:hypothetical protein M0804_010590 [Polistes exclamans]
MNIIIFIIFSLTFITINCDALSCAENPSCKCSSISENILNMDCIVNNSTKYTINIESKNYLKIICENWNGWDNFNFTSKIPGKTVNSVEFKNCGISNKISLKDVIKRLGIEETETLIFKSFNKLNGTLKREHLAGFSKVKILNLSNNGITSLTKDFLLDFPELEIIDLSDNDVILPNEIFDPTPNLTRIELYNNGMETLDIRLINKLKKLIFLDLMENELTEIADATFDNLVLLQTLLLEMNSLSVLSPYIFYQLRELDILDISMNNFSYIPSKLFDNNNKLNQLYLHHNKMGLETLPDYLLSNLTKLEEVYLNANGFKKLPKNLFWGSIYLTSIILSDNLLQTLPAMLFKGLENVIKLELNNNLIEFLPDKIFEDMSKLDILDLTGNNMVYITNNLFEGLKLLTILNMDRNRIKTIEPMAFFPTKSLIIAKLSHNQISFNNTDKKWNPFYNNTMLEELHLSNNSINSFISNWPFGEDNLRLLDLSSNNITYVVDDFFGTKGMCQNHCTCSIRLANLTRIMDCSNKGLSNFLINQSRVNFDNRYPLIINLTGNYLKEIPSLELLSKLNVTTLLLSNNNITQVTIDRIPKNLQVLHLHNNNISKVNLSVINYLKTKPLKEFTFGGNPIICDCDARDFYLFVQTMRYDYRDLGNVMCNNMSSPMFWMSFNDFIVCENWKGWEDFNFTSKLSGEIINSVEFKHCGISNKISLKDVVKRLGVKQTQTLIFQSSKYLYDNLKKDHLEGFPNVTKLVLAGNGLTFILRDFFGDFTELEWIDLSDNRLNLPIDIFDLTPNLKRIELFRNELKWILPGIFYDLKNLEFLNLMENELKEISAKIFVNLLSLKTLNLRRNDLSDLPEQIFDALEKLETLDISFNKFTYIQSKLFDRNKELRQLFFHHNEIHLYTLPDYLLSNLSKLEEVYLNNNGFKKLPQNLFWNSTSLKYINLNFNYLKTLPKNIFQGLRNIEVLSISNNMIRTLPDKIFKDIVNLDKLDLSKNDIVYITRDLFNDLTFLTELNMDSNYLMHIPKTALNSLLNLRIAKFSNNLLVIDNTTKWCSLRNNLFLEEFHLSYNDIEFFISDWSKHGHYLRLLDLSHNKIRTVSTNNLLIPSDMLKIDLRFNKITNILFIIGKKVRNYFTKKRNIEVIIDRNPISCDCQLYDILRYRENKIPHINYNDFNFTLENLSCIHTNGMTGPLIRNLNSTTYKCNEHEYFNTVKKCQDGCTCFVRPLDKTRILDCSNKNMYKFVLNETMVDFKQNYTLILNLTGNFLTEIPSLKSFKSINVTGLLLSNNQISHITVDKLPDTLTILELHNNKISKIEINLQAYVYSRSLKVFTLSGNPIECDCDTRFLLYFVQTKRFDYNDLDNVKCKDMDLPLYQMINEQLIVCINWESWNDLNFTSKLPSKMVKTVIFKNCGISNKISLKDVVKNLGVEETETLIFHSHENLHRNLYRWHLKGFSNVTKLVLSGNGLTYLNSDFFEDFTKLEWIDLSDNRLKFPNDIFDYTKSFKRLELSDNGLGSKDIKMLYELENLEFLNLMENELKELPADIFVNLVSLKTLNLRRNDLSDLPEQIFDALEKLETLDISFNKFTYIQSKLFDQNKQLRQLFFHHNELHLYTLPDYLLSNLTKLEDVYLNNNGFKKLPQNLFWNSTSLKYINLNFNYLKTLPKNIFQGIRNVKVLLISNNMIKTLPDNIFQDMINLEKLDLSRNNIVNISSDLFAGLTFLTELNMESNKISYIEETALNSLQHLRIADFTDNKLKLDSSNKWYSFRRNLFLEELHLSYNDIEFFISDWSKHGHYLRLLDLSHNKIRTVSVGDLLIPSPKFVIDLTFNKIANIFFNDDEKLKKYFSQYHNIAVLIDNNPILCDCQLYDLLCFRENRFLNFYSYYLNFTLGNLSCTSPNESKGPIIKYQDLKTYTCPEDKYFKISKNCQTGCDCKVRLYDNTRILDCSHRKMSEFLIDPKKVKPIEGYTLIVNLTGNLLTEIPSIQVLEPMNVTELLLSNNHISKMTTHGLPKTLKVLELHNNDISEFKLDEFGYVYSGVLDKFTLRGNPFTCNCSIRVLLHLIKRKRFLYKDLENLECDGLPMYKMTEDMLNCPTFNGWTTFLYTLELFIPLIVFTILFPWVHKRILEIAI